MATRLPDTSVAVWLNRAGGETADVYTIGVIKNKQIKFILLEESKTRTIIQTHCKHAMQSLSRTIAVQFL